MYAPQNLLDHVKDLIKNDSKIMNKRVKVTDAFLAKMLGTNAPVICKVRVGKIPLGDTLLLRIHELTGMSFGEMREMIGAKTSGGVI